MLKRQLCVVTGALVMSAVVGCQKEAEAPAPATKAEEAKPAAPPADESNGPKVVPGPGYKPECFAPWSADTMYLQWTAKKPPFRLALVNGYVGKAWRIQMG